MPVEKPTGTQNQDVICLNCQARSFQGLNAGAASVTLEYVKASMEVVSVFNFPKCLIKTADCDLRTRSQLLDSRLITVMPCMMAAFEYKGRDLTPSWPQIRML